MDDFPLSVFRFYFDPLEEIHLPPYKGSTFRGGFGTVFKKVVCVNREEECKNCLLNARCPYCYVFETPRDEETDFISTHLPHPYVLEPPLENKCLYLPGEVFSINLILFGKAIDYLPYFLFVMEELGRNGIGKGRGRFLLQRVENLSHPSDVQGRTVFEAKSRRIFGEILIRTFLDISNEVPSNTGQTLILHFLTPCRITYKNRLATPCDFNFLVLMKNLLRRIHLLGVHGGSGMRIDYETLLAQAEDVRIEENGLCWYDWERYSARQQSRMKFGGFKGKVAFKGEISPFLPYIKWGEYLHIGKETSFGLGKYTMELA